MSFVVTIRNSFSDEKYQEIVRTIRASNMSKNPKLLEDTKVELSIKDLKEMYDFMFEKIKGFDTRNTNI